MSFLSGAGLSVGCLISCLDFSLTVGDIFLNESPFWEGLSVGFLMTCLGLSLPVEGHFLNEFPFWGKSFC